MKWPFVSRETLDLALVQVAYFRDKAEQWEARYVEAVGPKKPVVQERTLDPISRAIRDAAGGNSALRGHLSHFARTERDKGVKDEVIVERIQAYADGPQPAKRDMAAREEADAALAEILDAP